MTSAYTDSQLGRGSWIADLVVRGTGALVTALTLASDTADYDETAYLFSTDANRLALERAMAQLESGEVWTGSLEDLAAEIGISWGAHEPE
jgi:hypothetical protein